MRIAETSPVTMTELWTRVGPEIARARSLERAGQILARTLYEHFEESVVLARIFLTVDFATIPHANQEFARGLAATAQATPHLSGRTPVLSLLGSHGERPAWCDRHHSKGHVGIPLISSAFVDGIPMISRLLFELGVPIDGPWRDSDVIQQTIGDTEGLFYVRSAADATDSRGRKVIVQQDFVRQHAIESVFGVGGAYANDEIMVLVVFCSEEIERDTAEQFLPLASLFKAQTATLVLGHDIWERA